MLLYFRAFVAPLWCSIRAHYVHYGFNILNIVINSSQ